jgi:chorismate mutase
MKTLGELRAEVDCIDQLIIEQLGRRKLLSLAIGRLKRKGK